MATTFDGVTLIQPQARTRFNMAALTPPAPTQPAPHKLVLVGPANQGQNAVVTVQTATDIRRAVGTSGDLAQAAVLTLDPSAVTTGAAPLSLYQVNPTTQGTIELKSPGSSGTTQISVSTTRWGTPANQIKAAVGSGTTTGYKLTVGDDASTAAPIVQDNLALPLVSLTVTGTTPKASVTDSTLTITTGSTTPTTLVSVSFSSTTTIQQVVNALNQNASVHATVADPNPADLAQALFDNVSGVAIGSSSPTTLSGNIVAVVRALNNGLQPWLTDAQRQANATTLATTGAWIYATGGSTTTATTSDWQDAYTALEQVQDVLWVVPISPTPSIWAMNQAHCAKMHGEGYGRSGAVGGSSGTTVAVAQANAASLASQYTAYLANGVQIMRNGVTTTIPPYQAVALITAVASGQPLNASVALKALNVIGLEQTYSASAVDTLVQAGCLVIKPHFGAFVVSKGQTTAAVNPGSTVDQTQWQAVSERFVLEYGMNQVLSRFVQQPITKTTAARVQTAIYHYLKKQAPSANQPTPLIQAVPKLSEIVVTITGTVITAAAPASPTVVADFVFTTLSASVDTAVA